MLVTVVMGIYNPDNQSELKEAIESVLNQTLTDIEFIICDDGSNEETKKTLEEFEKKDNRIKILTQKTNRGLAAALNHGIKEAKGKYIARMDGDDISKLNRFQVQYDFLENNQEYAFVGSNAELIDKHGVWGIRKMPVAPRARDFLPYSPFIHPSVMIRKESYLKCGGYQEGKGTWRSEDYEIFMRMYGLGIRGYNLQEILFQYRENQNAYCKRKYKYRIDEARIRNQYFKQLEVPFISRILYTMKPLIVGLIPVFLIARLKQVQVKHEVRNGRYSEPKRYRKQIKGKAIFVSSGEESIKAM